MRLHIFMALAILFAAPAAADLYKWVDERGGTHYSDRRPLELAPAAKIEGVENRVSVYSPDKSLVQAVEALRLSGSQSEFPTEPNRRPSRHHSAIKTTPPLAYEPCAVADCAAVSGLQYPYPSSVVFPIRRRPASLTQAVLPPGAIAGTINSNGAIPGNSASLNNVVPKKVSPGPRMRPYSPRSLREPPRQ